MSEGVCHFALGLSRKHEDLIELILVFLQPLNTTHRFIMVNAQHDEDHNNARSTSRMWVTMASLGYSHNGSKTNWGVSR